MFGPKSILVFCIAVTYSTNTSAFFFSWGSQSGTPRPLLQPWPFYQERNYQSAPSYNADPEAVQIPAIPIQVPLQAKFGSAPNVHNVQLVPCLCPVSQENEYRNQQDVVYLNQVKGAGNP